MSSDDDASSEDNDQKRLGDKLFDSDDAEANGRREETKKAAELSAMNPELVRKIIEADSPELLGLLKEFKEATIQAN